MDLRELLRQVPDPRDRRGIRHSVASILGPGRGSGVAGARSFAAIGEWAADAPAACAGRAGRAIRFPPQPVRRTR
ncbi:transposase family protein [Amycolatopsis sp. NPDC004368]